MSAKILAVDPGKGGGAALLHARRVVSVHTFVTDSDFLQYVRDCQDYGVDVCYIEKVGSMPGQGVASTFKFGDNNGMIRGVVLALRIPIRYVTPQKWQKGLMLPKAKSKTDHKRNLKHKAIEMYPDPGGFTLATCDAILIADYGQREYGQTG